MICCSDFSSLLFVRHKNNWRNKKRSGHPFPEDDSDVSPLLKILIIILFLLFHILQVAGLLLSISATQSPQRSCSDLTNFHSNDIFLKF